MQVYFLNKRLIGLKVNFLFLEFYVNKKDVTLWPIMTTDERYMRMALSSMSIFLFIVTNFKNE